ncbi:MAG: hypothetical protein ACO32I_01245 [Candidatus Limnocylindrus sp.]
MMTSEQIAQANSHAFSMGYGANPQFGYEPRTGFTPMGYGAGSQFGVGALTGLDSTLQTASLLGLGGLLGRGALRMTGLANTALGGKIASGLGAVANITGTTLPMPIAGFGLMPAMAAIGGLASGARQLSQTQNTLDQAFGNRTNMGGGFGFGMSRQATLGITETIRSLKAMPSLMTDMGELQGILDKVSSMGMMQAVRNAGEFKSKFTGMVQALREMSRDLGSTMEQAMPFLQSSVRQGFLDPQQMRRNVTFGVATSRIGIGMRSEDVMQMQEQGAGIVRSLGGDARVGATGMRDMLGTLSIAQQQGVITQDDVTRITGQTGSEGIKSLSSMIFGAQTQMFQQSGAGKFITAALAERDKSGKFTGKLNKDMISKLRRGEIAVDELMSQGNKMLSGLSNSDATSFMNSMSRGMGAEAAAQIGPAGTAQAITSILESLGAKDEEAQRFLVAKMTGLRQDAADAALKIMRDSARLQDEQTAQIRNAVLTGRSAAYFKENLTLGGKLHHAGTALQSVFVDPFQRAGAGMATRMGQRFDQSIMDFMYADGFMSKLGSIPGGIMHTMGLNPFREDPHTLREGTTGRGLSALARRQMAHANAEATVDMGDGSLVSDIAGGALAGGAVGSVVPVIGTKIGAVVGGVAGAARNLILSGTEQSDATRLFGSSVRFNASGEGVVDTNVFNARSFTDAERASAVRALKKSGLTSDVMKGSKRGFISDVSDLSTREMSALEVLQAASLDEGATGQLAGEMRDRLFKQATGGKILSTEDYANAQSSLNDLFNPGMLSSLFGLSTMGEDGSSFLSDTAASVVTSGTVEQQSDLQKILASAEMREQLQVMNGNPRFAERARRIIERLLGKPLSLSDEQLVSLSVDIAEGYNEHPAFADELFNRVASTMKKHLDTQTEYEGGLAEAELSSIYRGVQDADLKNTLLSKDISAAGLAKIERQARVSKGTDRLSKSLQSAFSGGSRIGKSTTEAQAIDKLKAIGLDEAAISQYVTVDDNFTDAERANVDRMLKFSGAISPELDRNMSSSGQRAKKLGLDAELDIELHRAQKNAIDANITFVQEVGKVLPSLRPAANNYTTSVVESRTTGGGVRK